MKNNQRRDFIKSGLAATGILLTGVSCASPSQTETNPAVDEISIWDIFEKRRSVRKFKPDAVPMEHIKKILNAARMAPTSGNQQPWKFVVVTDAEKIKQITEETVLVGLEMRKKHGKITDKNRDQIEQKIRGYAEKYMSAPAYIVVLTNNDSKWPTYNQWDGALTAGYLLLAARALGYGSVYITDAIPDSVTKKVLNIPDNYTRICITPIGIPDQWPETPTKKALDELIVENNFKA